MAEKENQSDWLPKKLLAVVHYSSIKPEIASESDEKVIVKFLGLIDAVGELNGKLGKRMTNAFQNIINIFAERYMDNRLLDFGIQIFNKRFLVYTMKKDLGDCFRQAKTFKDVVVYFRKFARIDMDLNGLKIFNDFASKKVGDEVIKRVSFCLASDVKILNFCKNNSLETLLTSEGGDEYGFWVKSTNGYIMGTVLDEFCALIRRQVGEIDVSDIFNLSDENILNNCALKGVRVHDNAKLELAMACGHYLAYEALIATVTEKKFLLLNTNIAKFTRKDYEALLNRILFHVFFWSGDNTKKQKNRDQEDDKTSANENRNLRAVMKQRTGEAMCLLQENIDLKEEVERLKKELEELKKTF